MTVAGRLAAVVLGLVAATGPNAGLASQQRIPAAYDQGIARVPEGWVVSGRDSLARLDDSLVVVQAVDPAIPPEWAARGFDHVGDVEVVGGTVYAPWDRPDDTKPQAMARYDAETLEFRGATLVDQHSAAFVAVDATTGIAYTMDRFGGDELLRYDVRAGWRPLTPLVLDRRIARVQGGAVARDQVWLATDDERNGVYRVDIDEGAVAEVVSAPPVAGEGEGVDASTLPSGDLHVTVLEPDRTAVVLDHFQSGTTSDGAAAASTAAREAEASWPPALVSFAVFVAVITVSAVGTVFWRARRTVRPRR